MPKTDGARMVQVDRVAIPDRASLVHPNRVLKEPHWSCYSNLNDMIIQVARKLLRPRLMIDPIDEDRLWSLLVASGMAEPVPEEDVLRFSGGKKVLSGDFAVGEQRAC